MHTTKRKKRNRGLGKVLASLLMVTLLVNQVSVPVFAAEIRDAVCLCDVRCSVDHVNEACVVCAENYEKCEAAETGSDNFTDDNPEDSGSNEDVNTDTDTNVTPDDDADDDPEDSGSNGDGNTDTDTNVTPDDGADDDSEGSDSDEDVNADADIVADIKTENVFSVDDEAEIVMEEESVSPAAEGDTFTDGAFTYTVMSEDENNRQVELTGPVEGTAVSGDLVIPATASDGTNEYAVVKIGGFKDCSSITSVVIPDSVTTIWGSAFYNCTGMTNITIPDSVTTIRGSAFYNCNSLMSIHIPKDVTIINRATFRYCRSLKSVIIPEGVTSIGRSAFEICDNLESVTIPDSVTVIESSAFGLCKSLRSVTISGNVTNIGAAAFAFCYSLESVTLLNDHINFGMGAFADDRNLKSFQIAVSEDITATPTVGSVCFNGVLLGEDTYLTFLTKDGTRELSHTTTPTLAEAVAAYNAVDDSAEGGSINDGYWYGWRLPEVPEVTGYPVTIHGNKDGAAWEDCAKEFALSADNGVTFITDLTDVANGTYTIYEITGDADHVNTGVSVAVADAAAEATIDYYTVTFYSDGTVFDERVVRKNENVSAPSATPTKDGYTFYRWVTSEGGTTEFHFENPITAKTDIYAGWIENEKETFTIIASAGDGGSVSPSGEVKVKSGDDQQFIMTPKAGYRIASVLVDGSEVLSREQTAAEAKAGISDGENNTKYYIFENVTGNHTLAAYFEAVQSDDNPPGDGGDNPDKPGGSGGGDKNPDEPGGGNSPEEPDGGDGNKNPDEPDGGNGDNGPDGDGSGNNADNFEVSRSTFDSDTSVMPKTDTVRHGDDRAPGSGNSEPKTGDATGMEIYATIAMVAGLAYLLLYFADGKNGMTEEEKKETVAALIRWAKRGKRIRKYAALAAIFLILVYYHSIGKRTAADWKAVYEK